MSLIFQVTYKLKNISLFSSISKNGAKSLFFAYLLLVDGATESDLALFLENWAKKTFWDWVTFRHIGCSRIVKYTIYWENYLMNDVPNKEIFNSTDLFTLRKWPAQWSQNLYYHDEVDRLFFVEIDAKFHELSQKLISDCLFDRICTVQKLFSDSTTILLISHAS